ncbi:hypothetical protein VD0001_g3616 [Verticillium dahliae]|nr:hypothetical protein VD0001_g3616 [Verticillium dahliae]
MSSKPHSYSDLDPRNLTDQTSVDDVGSSMHLRQTQEFPRTETAQPGVPLPLDENLQHFIHEKKALSDACSQLNPWSIHEPSSRVGSVIASFKEFPALFVRRRETPFLHRHLYRAHTPHAILTVYSAVTTYADCTDANRSWAIRVLCEAADELTRLPRHSQGNEKEATQAPSLETADPTPLDKLARTQALLIYQQIRVFDGDIGLQEQAERDMGTLETWLEDLETYRDNLAELWLLEEIVLRSRPPQSWERWIFAECVRRTIWLGYGFIGLVAMLKTVGIGGTPLPGRFAAVHRWTASKHLWEADSSHAFMMAWREKKQYIVQNLSIQRLPRSIKATDTDDMIKLLLAWLMGPDEMKQWVKVDKPKTCEEDSGKNS